MDVACSSTWPRLDISSYVVFKVQPKVMLKRASFTSTEDLRQRILDFIEYFNKTMAKPFKWTYKGKPLTA